MIGRIALKWLRLQYRHPHLALMIRAGLFGVACSILLMAIVALIMSHA